MKLRSSKRATVYVAGLMLFAAAAVGLGAAVSLTMNNLPNAARTLAKEAAYVEGEVLVKFKPDAAAASRAAALRSVGASAGAGLGKLGWTLLKLPSGASALQAISGLQGNPAVEHVQPNYRYYATAVPNDASYGQLWGLRNTGQPITSPAYGTNNPGAAGSDIDAELAWDQITDCSSIVVAVLDTGINYTHQDLAANMWNGNTFHGFDFIDNDNDNNPMPTGGSEQHGTHVAGTIGAMGNNAIGTTGVCWNLQIISVRVLGADGSGTTAGIIQGIEFASDNGAGVINMSLGGYGPEDTAFRNAIVYARDRDVVVIVAAGNETNNNDVTPSWPCSFDVANLLCVAALDQAYQLADFSNWGATRVDVGAPGTNVLSTWPGPDIQNDGLNWTVSTVSGTAWASTSCVFSGDSFWTLANPGINNLFCGGNGTYSNNNNATIYKNFNLSGLTAAAASYFAFHALETNFDFVRGYANGAGGNPTNTQLIGSLNGNTGGSAPFYEHQVPASCLTSTCTIGFTLTSDGSVTGAGAAIVLLTVSGIQPNANSYSVINGTSMASPHVAGLAALVRAFNPDYDYADTVAAISQGGESAPALAGITSTGRSVNAMGSLAHITTPQGVSAVVDATAPVNAAGTWSIIDTNDSNTCGDPTGVPEMYDITVTQNGVSITVATPVGTFSGTVNGNSVSWSGSYPENGGTTTITSLMATVLGDSLSGSTSWSWTDGVDSCSGSNSFTGARV